jgi:Ca2+-binding RTX toxin-like protein
MGGAVFNHQGVLRVTNSTLTGNSAIGGSGGEAGTGLGGAIFNLNGIVLLRHATVAANAAVQGGGGAYSLGYDAVVGRIAAIRLVNAILADSAASVDDVVVAAPETVAGGATNQATDGVDATEPNIVESHGVLGPGATFTGAPITADPGLHPLAYYGGPGMFTMRPSATGPAVDAAESDPESCLPVDERGVARPVGPECDLGAFEVDDRDEDGVPDASDLCPGTPSGTPVNTDGCPVNTAPVAANDSYGVVGGATVSVPAPGVLGNDSDADGNALTAAVVTPPSSGVLVLNSNGSFTYAPAENATSGSVTFTYKASDGQATSNLATVTITITAGCDGVPATITGTAGNDTIGGTSGNDVIIGLGGNDRITSGSGNDRVCGGAGNDVVDSGSDNDRVFGGTGNDSLTTGSGDDFLSGGDGDDILDSGGDRDRLFGDGGVDRLAGGGDSDALDGGAGTPDRCDGEGGADTATACEVTIGVP